MDSINGRNPNKATPAKVEASMINNDINGVVVASFPPEELGDIDQLKYYVDKETSCNLAILL